MNMVFGFGSTEQAVMHDERVDTEAWVFERSQEAEFPGYFLDELVAELTAYLEQRAANSRDVSDGYKDASDYPDRYSSHHVSVLHDASHIIVIRDFIHINRKHPMSADGWGMMCDADVQMIRTRDLPDRKGEGFSS